MQELRSFVGIYSRKEDAALTDYTLGLWHIQLVSQGLKLPLLTVSQCKAGFMIRQLYRS